MFIPYRNYFIKKIMLVLFSIGISTPFSSLRGDTPEMMAYGTCALGRLALAGWWAVPAAPSGLIALYTGSRLVFNKYKHNIPFRRQKGTITCFVISTAIGVYTTYQSYNNISCALNHFDTGLKKW